jgi:hypothetical protein
LNQGFSYELEAVMPMALDTGLFVSLCTIQQPSGNLGVSGAPDRTYVNISGLVDIPCTSAPTSIGSISATERKSVSEIQQSNANHVLLGGHYPQIENGSGQGWRAVIDGINYDLLGAESDSQGQMTRIEVLIVRM